MPNCSNKVATTIRTRRETISLSRLVHLFIKAASRLAIISWRCTMAITLLLRVDDLALRFLILRFGTNARLQVSVALSTAFRTDGGNSAHFGIGGDRAILAIQEALSISDPISIIWEYCPDSDDENCEAQQPRNKLVFKTRQRALAAKA
jgi:hypothetical protein